MATDNPTVLIGVIGVYMDLGAPLSLGKSKIATIVRLLEDADGVRLRLEEEQQPLCLDNFVGTPTRCGSGPSRGLSAPRLRSLRGARRRSAPCSGASHSP